MMLPVRNAGTMAAVLGLLLFMLMLAAVALVVPCLLGSTLALGAALSAESLLGLAAGSWGCQLAAAAGGAVGFWGGMSRHLSRCAFAELLQTGELLGTMTRRRAHTGRDTRSWRRV